ncbi:hypothetical protein [Nostoc sp. NOS(2021)]|uniref:hypothetical protein n=1 Tax=Nostoc sp. NOS(2021) TaxID=2815407 RepID=UPI0025E5CAF5|nr:hypothetical protein [Nostoc sp. NOS(2021)]
MLKLLEDARDTEALLEDFDQWRIKAIQTRQDTSFAAFVEDIERKMSLYFPETVQCGLSAPCKISGSENFF